MFLFSPGFGIGVTLIIFHSLLASERLTGFKSVRAILQAVCFNIFANLPLYPVDLLILRIFSRSYTDSSVDSSCSGQLSACKFSSRASEKSVKA